MAVLLMAGCAHRKSAVSGGKSHQTENVTHGIEDAIHTVTAIQRNRQKSQFLTSKASVSVNLKGKRSSLSGNLRMKRDDVIQLSLTALGILEVGRMELTHDYIMLVDRMGKQYVKASYSEVPGFSEAGIDFYSFQSLFWDELFLPGDRGQAPQPSQFTVGKAGEGPSVGAGQVAITQAEGHKVILTFLASLTQHMVEQTTVSLANSRRIVEWTYADYEDFKGQPFPTRMTIQIPSSSADISAVLTLKSLKDDSRWETRTKLNEGRYRAVDIESLKRRIRLPEY